MLMDEQFQGMRRGEDNYFHVGHIKFEVSITHPVEISSGQFDYTSLKLRSES